MTASRPQVEQILKTLPIGYYIKRDVKVKLIDDDCSFYDIMHDEISISYPMIERVCQSLQSNELLENDIRCLLYHEVSHAFLTPKSLSISDIVNIFEDERIESILRNFYLNVDFRNFVKRVNNFKGEKPKSAIEMFYQVVRYRIGPVQFLDRVHDIIMSNLTFNNRLDVNDYAYDVKCLYDDIKKYFNEQQQHQQTQSSQSQSDEENTQSQPTETYSQSDEENTQSQSSNEVEENETVDSEQISEEQAREIIDKKIARFDDNELKDELDKILSSIKSIKKNNGSAINAYSGIFNSRSVVREDYKFFVQQNRAGHVKAFSKLHLNLFIDCSGSFHKNDKVTNQLLKALIAFEKSNSDFSFTLISCGEGQRIRDKSDRIQHSTGGTEINEEIFQQFKQVQETNAQNINIVLYDGDACEGYSNYYRDHYGRCFSAFNNASSVVIVDPQNERYMHHCKNAKVILTRNYTQELKKNVLNALRILCK